MTTQDAIRPLALVTGLDVTENPDSVRRLIGVVAQGSGVDIQATGRENLRLQGQIHGIRGQVIEQRIAERQLEEVRNNSIGKRMPIDRQVAKSDDGEPKRVELVHQPPVPKIPLIIDDRTRQQKHLAGVFLCDPPQKHSLLLMGQIVDAFDGGDHVVTGEWNVQEVGGLESGV